MVEIMNFYSRFNDLKLMKMFGAKLSDSLSRLLTIVFGNEKGCQTTIEEVSHYDRRGIKLLSKGCQRMIELIQVELSENAHCTHIPSTITTPSRYV